MPLRDLGSVRGRSGTLAQVNVSSLGGIMGAMETIYVALADEAVDVWRPVEAVSEGGSIYRIGDPAARPHEAWEFPPGSRVRCERRDLGEGRR
jgi:hypothetical protein